MESVKYVHMREVYRKERQEGMEELDNLGSDIHGLNEQIQHEE